MERIIDEATVRDIAHLSRLEITDTEATQYTEQLAAILEYASHLPELDVTIQSSQLWMDDDEAHQSPDPAEFLKNAVAVEDGYVKVPSILDRSES